MDLEISIISRVARKQSEKKERKQKIENGSGEFGARLLAEAFVSWKEMLAIFRRNKPQHSSNGLRDNLVLKLAFRCRLGSAVALHLRETLVKV